MSSKKWEPTPIHTKHKLVNINRTFVVGMSFCGKRYLITEKLSKTYTAGGDLIVETSSPKQFEGFETTNEV